MVCGVVEGPSLKQAEEQIERGNRLVDVIELRVDRLEVGSVDQLRALRDKIEKPLILTLRRENFSGTEEERLHLWKACHVLYPDYIDLEWNAELPWLETLGKEYAESIWICSYHNFDETPDNLSQIFEKMQERRASIYKLATWAKSSLDALRMLQFVKECSHASDQVIGIGMGAKGTPSRILGKVCGNQWTYASLKEESNSLGQVSAETLLEKFRYQSLGQETCVLGLVGDPVAHSVSDHVHNSVYGNVGINTVYVKWEVEKGEFASFIKEAGRIGFYGFAVTMPHKERAWEMASEKNSIGAINTLKWDQRSLSGCHTDGKGAVQALLEKTQVTGQRVALIGAGGAARAIALELVKEGADLHVFNRDEKKGVAFAKKIGAHGYPLKAFTEWSKGGYTVLINGTSLGMQHDDPLPVKEETILEGSVVMDVVAQPIQTALLREAKRKKCTCVYGYEMLLAQAVFQAEYWFPEVKADWKKEFQEAYEQVCG